MDPPNGFVSLLSLHQSHQNILNLISAVQAQLQKERRNRSDQAVKYLRSHGSAGPPFSSIFRQKGGRLARKKQKGAPR